MSPYNPGVEDLLADLFPNKVFYVVYDNIPFKTVYQ